MSNNGISVGICTVELYLHGNHSLKGKRQVLKSIKDRVRHKFNVSIAEVGETELWQRAQLGIVTVSNDRRYVNTLLTRVVNFIETASDAEMIDYSIELL